MLSLSQIRKFIDKSENPLIIFDDDPDGLCSFLLIKRAFNKANGYVLKGSPYVTVDLLDKIKDFYPDLILILDLPVLTQEFADKINVPMIWIDHHPPLDIKGVHRFNPHLIKKTDSRPTTYWCYKLVKKDIWLAAIGNIADWHKPDFLKEFTKKYPGLANENDKTEDLLFKSELGRLAKIFFLILKNNTSIIDKCISLLSRIDSPYEILNQETEAGKYIYSKAQKIWKKYDLILLKAKQIKPDKNLVIFTYSSESMSFTGEIANELNYIHKDKIILVGRQKDDKVNFSLRSEVIKVLPILEKSLIGLKGSGGGHDHACGGNIDINDFSKLVTNLRDNVNKTSK
ncbi:DHH family phosphoesterase [Candidatus Woesearchaeota archaeon]|nr:DHH family phosphoesterase [Candidatus Woesearchaeota archaeon]